MAMGAGEAGYGDEDRLPWLETVEDDYREGPSVWRILLLILLGLAVIGAVGFGYWWYQKQQGLSGGTGELINAAEGDYKVPDTEAGMNVEGVGVVASAAGEGQASNASVDMGAVPETPVEGKAAPKASTTGAGSARATVAVPQSGGKLEAKAPVAVPTVAPAAGGGGAVIQLGAFPDQSGADTAWNRLSKRYAYLAPLGKSVQAAQKDGKTIYRLRVNTGSNSQAKEICGRLKVAGENCYLAN